MKKLLVGMAALSVCAAANADVKFSGNTYLSYTNTKNESGEKDRNNNESWTAWNTLNLDANKSENLAFHLQLKHVAYWGQRVGVNPTAGSAPTGAPARSVAEASNDTMYVQEAYGWAKMGDNGSLTFGRSGLELNSGELISKQSFEDSNIAFDGIRYVHDADWGRLGVSYSVSGRVDNTGTSSDNHIKFRGLSYTFKNLPEMISNLELHYVNSKIDKSSYASGLGKANGRTWIGFNVKGDMSGVDYRVNFENYKADGDEVANALNDDKSTMMDIEVGYAMPNMMDSRVYLQFHKDGGKDGKYDPLYYDKHKFAGLMDVAAWGNLTQTSIGYNFKPQAGCEAGIAYHMFKETEKAGAKDKIGSEIDVFFKHTYESGLFVEGELGTFKPEQDELGKETIQRLYVGTGFDF